MRSGARFGQILDEKLADVSSSAGSPRVDAPPPFPLPGFSPAFLFCASFPAGTRASTVASAYAAPASHARLSAPRVLSAAQARALECLRSLGVPGLESGYTEAELKSAFRRIALTLHPDRHLQASACERQYLARAFGSACDAYRELRRVFVH